MASQQQTNIQMSPIVDNRKQQYYIQERPYIQYTHTPVYEQPQFHLNYPQQNMQDNDQDSIGSRNWFMKNDHYKPLNAEERPAFVRKVYAIMIIQLILTTIMCVLSYVVIGYRNFQINNTGIVYLALAISLLIEIFLFCVPKMAWKVPYNYICLFIFTICEGYMISCLCSYVFWKYSDNGGNIRLYEVSLYQWLLHLLWHLLQDLPLMPVKRKVISQLKVLNDQSGAFLFMVALTLFIFAIMSGIYYSQVVNLLYSVICALLFGVYIIYDTQLIIGGQTHQLTIDDYIIGAMIIYIDIIYLFANILMIIIACLK